MVDWGFNFVRLGVMWESVERTPGVYDEEYLDLIEEIINNLGEKGIFTLVDMHQDVLSRKTCGEGVPLHVVENVQTECPSGFTNWLTSALGVFNGCKPMSSFNIENDEDGLPIISQCMARNFWDYQFAAETQDTYARIYYNINNT
jgi:endoglycosylceramidase